MQNFECYESAEFLDEVNRYKLFNEELPHVLQVVIFHVERHPNVTWYEQCVAFNMFPTKTYEMTYRILGMIMMYGLPLVLITISYACIIAEIFRRYQLSPDGTDRKNLELGAPYHHAQPPS
jgi:hypothetical protein